MTRHRPDIGSGAREGARLKQFLRIERMPERAWPRAAREAWLRRQRDPLGRTVEAFAAIERGHRA